MKALSRNRLAAVLYRSEPKLRSKANNPIGDINMRNTTLRLKLAACAVAVFISACGGGDASAPASGGAASIGFAVDGYLNGATVLCDTNGNGVADIGERTVTTDSSGFFRFTSQQVPSAERRLRLCRPGRTIEHSPSGPRTGGATSRT